VSQEGQPNGEVPGWVILSPGAVPDAWLSRTIPMVLVPLTPAEARQLLSDAPVEQGIAAADLPLVRLVARGHSATEIARALGVSPRTVHRHVARLSDEFGVATIQELATELARRGF
jgi:DNA-binding CsgD family transcriptional regulator